MKYVVVINNSMVVTGCRDGEVPLFTVITPRTEPMHFHSFDEAKHVADLDGPAARVWTEEDYANGAGVMAQFSKSGKVVGITGEDFNTLQEACMEVLNEFPLGLAMPQTPAMWWSMFKRAAHKHNGLNKLFDYLDDYQIEAALERVFKQE